MCSTRRRALVGSKRPPPQVAAPDAPHAPHSQCHLQLLPPDLLLQVLGMLKGRELHALELTCKTFHSFLQSPVGSTAYKHALLSEFGSQTAAQELCAQDWKRAYVRTYVQARADAVARCRERLAAAQALSSDCDELLLQAASMKCSLLVDEDSSGSTLLCWVRGMEEDVLIRRDKAAGELAGLQVEVEMLESEIAALRAHAPLAQLP